MQTIMRILYGKLISRRGRNSSKSGLRARRNAIFAFMTTLNDSERQYILDLMLEPFKAVLAQPDPDTTMGLLVINDGLPLSSLGAINKQLGFLNIFTINLSFDFAPYMPALFSSYISSRVEKFQAENTQATSALLELIAAWAENRSYLQNLVVYNVDLLPAVLSLLSAKKVHDSVVGVVIHMIECIQNHHDDHPDEHILQKTLLPLITPLLGHLEHVLSQIIESSAAAGVAVRLVGDTLAMRIVRVLARLSSYVTAASNAETLLGIITPFLKRHNKSVPEATKVEILEILGHFLPILPSIQKSAIDSPYYSIISKLFMALSGRDARSKLLFVFRQLAQFDADQLSIVADLLDSLNAYSTKRLDEPDFDRRFEAFTQINEQLYMELTPHQWRPILYCLVYYTQEVEEYAVRTSAAFGLKRFIAAAVAVYPDGIVNRPATAAKTPDSSPREVTHMNLLMTMLLPCIKTCLKHSSLEVRSEFCSILGLLTQTFPKLVQFRDMVVLLVDGDEEASFFNNIYHLQAHRRVRAMNRLADAAKSHKISSSNLSSIFLPIILYYIFDSDRKTESSTIQIAVSTVGACSTSLNWNHYYGLLKRILMAIPKRPELEKVLIRTVIEMLGGFHFDMTGTGVAGMEVDNHTAVGPGAGDANVDVAIEADAADDDDDGNDDDQDLPDVTATADDPSTAVDGANDGSNGMQAVNAAETADEMLVDEAATVPVHNPVPQVPQWQKIHDVVANKILPTLQNLINIKDDEMIPVRIPLAIAITKVLKNFPEASMHRHLPK
eukprot:jgi/Hompol1/229/HPOL_000684-RA